jgi:hypothetical protein
MWVIDRDSISTGVSIQISPDSGLYWTTLSGDKVVDNEDAAVYSGDTGTFSWPVTSQLASGGDSYNMVSSQCLVKVEGTYEPNLPQDVSDSTFAILSGGADVRERVAGGTPINAAPPAVVGTVVRIRGRGEFSLRILDATGKSLLLRRGRGDTDVDVGRARLPCGEYLFELHAGVETVRGKFLLLAMGVVSIG